MKEQHGHVTPRADGARAKCGGPRICATCQQEEADLLGEGQITYDDVPAGVPIENEMGNPSTYVAPTIYGGSVINAAFRLLGVK